MCSNASLADNDIYSCLMHSLPKIVRAVLRHLLPAVRVAAPSVTKSAFLKVLSLHSLSLPLGPASLFSPYSPTSYTTPSHLPTG